jgi:hypothetical protein
MRRYTKSCDRRTDGQTKNKINREFFFAVKLPKNQENQEPKPEPNQKNQKGNMIMIHSVNASTVVFYETFNIFFCRHFA